MIQNFDLQICLNESIYFLFAHFDDEFTCLPLIIKLSKLKTLNFIYVAENLDYQIANLRFQRSKEILNRLCINKPNFIRVRDHIYTEDLELSSNLFELFYYLDDLIPDHACMFTLTWEGGHPDHDSLFALCTVLKNSKLKCKIYSFPAYNKQSNIMPYHVMCPNPQIKSTFVLYKFQNCPIFDCFVFFLIIFTYPKQLLTFIGLGAGIFYRYVLRRSIYIIMDVQITKVKCTLIDRRFKKNYSEFYSQINYFLNYFEK